MVVPIDKLSDWERVLAAERHVQYLIPGAILIGGTAAALHARHRISMDGDHVLEDLRDRFGQVLATIEAVAGWQTERVQQPVLILGQPYQLARADRKLRARIHRIVLTVPVALPHFWLAALASLGEAVDIGAPVPDYYEATGV